jgi:hypothetical protein
MHALVAIAAVALASPLCAPAEDPGRIYVYAQRLTAADSWLPVSCGGSVVAALKQGMFFAINVPPGRHALTPGTGVPAFVEVRSGGEVFVRLDWNFEVGRRPIPVLTAVRPDQAHKQMVYLSYVNPRKVLSNSVPTTDPREPAQLRLKGRGVQ